MVSVQFDSSGSSVNRSVIPNNSSVIPSSCDVATAFTVSVRPLYLNVVLVRPPSANLVVYPLTFPNAWTVSVASQITVWASAIPDPAISIVNSAAAPDVALRRLVARPFATPRVLIVLVLCPASMWVSFGSRAFAGLPVFSV